MPRRRTQTGTLPAQNATGTDFISVSIPCDMQREIRVLRQAIQRAEQEPYGYLATHLKERLRLIQEEVQYSWQ